MAPVAVDPAEEFGRVVTLKRVTRRLALDCPFWKAECMPDDQQPNADQQPNEDPQSEGTPPYQPAPPENSETYPSASHQPVGAQSYAQNSPYGAQQQHQQPAHYPSQPDAQAPYGVPTHVQVSLTPGNGLGVTSLVLGILALLGAFIPFINYVSGFLAVIGLVLGAIALARKGRPKGTAIAGVVISAIALILSVVLAFSYTAGFFSAVDDSLPKTEIRDSSAEASPGVENESQEANSAEPALGMRENPAAIGTPIQLTSAGAVQYDVTLGTVVLNANQLVAAANPYNDDPPAGFQYALVPVTVVYQGTETGTPWTDITLEFVSAAGTTHKSYDVSVVEPAPTFTDINELYTGASGTGNIVVAIPTADAEAGTWAVSGGAFSDDAFFFKAQ